MPALFPEVFLRDNAGFDVLIASDAVGMGLNLNIRRVVFSAVEKFDGDCTRAVSVEEVLATPIPLLVACGGSACLHVLLVCIIPHW